ncbi:cell division protein FtsA [Natribacillus halophilus]|uniref:Cell division protein FtsA n=1 Tax=Natribacillus halophilus TaxID=549003 RepID=A0A1G8MES9_9BACI|nr:cell division protein FtsA [Natribacillus halophilus]SDI66489.1 cell division protein FtsA [Natribacillus halophilus]
MDNNEIYVSLDVGTTEVKVMIGEISAGMLNIIGVGTAPSNGIKKGAVVDIDATVKSIRQAVEKAERMVGVSINQVVVGINGSHIQLQPCHGIVAVSSPHKEITQEDIDRVMDAAQVVSIPRDREVVDIVPSQFIVDGYDEINDPTGMIGVRLEMEGLLVSGSKTVLHNLLRCVERADLEISDIFLQPLAAGEVSVSRDERNLGVALVDIGGSQTTISTFKDGSLVTLNVVPIGGAHITNDLSVGLRATQVEAERVKVSHGHAYIDDTSEEVLAVIQPMGSHEQEEYSQRELAEIIEPRMEEIYEIVAEELSSIGDIPGGVVLTGGTVMMPGSLELAREMLGRNIRMAIPDYIGVREPRYTNGVGLIEFAHLHVKMNHMEMVVATNDDEEQPPLRKARKAGKQRTDQGEESPGVRKRVRSFFKVFFE